MRLLSPTGLNITGTDDRVPGIAIMNNSHITRLPDGRYDLDANCEGSTEIEWNGQQTCMALGSRVFVDEEGNLWLERELILAPENPQWAEIHRHRLANPSVENPEFTRSMWLAAMVSGNGDMDSGYWDWVLSHFHD